MKTTINNLSGYFDGFMWHQGPVNIEFVNDKITEIRFGDEKQIDIDGSSQFLSPGFNDGHTHLIFAGERSAELSLKVRGAQYSEILEKGGGILNTIKPTREASNDELLELVLARLDTMLAHGTLMVEAKSGYGLNTEDELRLLEILNNANRSHPIEVVPTFCGAHALPPGIKREDYVEEVISIIPEVVKRNLATTTDVFCDKGAFSVLETRQILEASKNNNLPIRVHAEELQYTGIGKIAAEEFNALSVDHLLYATEEDFKIYNKSNSVAMFMPAAVIGLFTDQRPTGWKNTGVTIGLGSDFNPNNWIISMQTAIRLGVYLYRLQPEIAFKSAISGSHKGITGTEIARLKEGVEANFILINSNNIDQFITKFDQNLVQVVYKSGKKLDTT